VNEPFGLLNVDKSPGWTSRDAVNRVARLVRPAKAGHAGTLDPLATGVLVVCVGRATRLVEYVQQQPKRYEAAFLLGRRSETDDVEGHVEELDAPIVPTRDQLDAALSRFVGEIEQRPPAYSAVKIGGKRAYRLAREGRPVAPPPRKVRVYELAILSYDYPTLELEILCGSGTYVRSLGRDLAAAVGTSAVMHQLCRTAVGVFKLDSAVRLDGLEAADLERSLLPAAAAVAHLPRLALSDTEIESVRHGRFLTRQDNPPSGELAAFDAKGQLIAILAADAQGRLRPHCNFASPS
jgi:tRNA pseudouridine55 synthase